MKNVVADKTTAVPVRGPSETAPKPKPKPKLKRAEAPAPRSPILPQSPLPVTKEPLPSQSPGATTSTLSHTPATVRPLTRPLHPPDDDIWSWRECQFRVCDTCEDSRTDCLWYTNSTDTVRMACQACQTDQRRKPCSVQGRLIDTQAYVDITDDLKTVFAQGFKRASAEFLRLNDGFRTITANANDLSAAMAHILGDDYKDPFPPVFDVPAKREEDADELSSDADDPAVVPPDTDTEGSSDPNEE